MFLDDLKWFRILNGNLHFRLLLFVYFAFCLFFVLLSNCLVLLPVLNCFKSPIGLVAIRFFLLLLLILLHSLCILFLYYFLFLILFLLFPFLFILFFLVGLHFLSHFNLSLDLSQHIVPKISNGFYTSLAFIYNVIFVTCNFGNQCYFLSQLF